MADDFEHRLGNLENRFDEYMAMFYRWLDEQRTETREMKREHEERMRLLEADSREYRERTDSRFQQNEQLLAELVRSNDELVRQNSVIVSMQGDTLRLIEKMDIKLDNHDGRLNRAGI